jgi:hypothetical protein
MTANAPIMAAAPTARAPSVTAVMAMGKRLTCVLQTSAATRRDVRRSFFRWNAPRAARVPRQGGVETVPPGST